MVIQLVVSAAVVTRVLSWELRAQLRVTQMASQLEHVTVMRPVAMQVTAQTRSQVAKQVTPQASHMWLQVSVQVRTQVDHGHCFLPHWEPTVCDVVQVLPDRSALFGGSGDCSRRSHCPGRVLSGSTLRPGGKSPSWREN